MQTIAPKLVYLDRGDWGANTSLPRLGHIVPNDKRTEMIHHHDVIVDDDLTKNIWEDIGEVKRGMRRLQTIRPKLGLDVPYNFEFFAMADGSAILCEGRGYVRTGAHTIGHNTSGIAICWHGNTMLPIDMSKWTTHLSHAWGWLKYDKGLSRLGTVVTGHRDYYATACPGDNLYAALPDITPTRYQVPTPPEEDEDMKPYVAWDRDRQRIYLVGPWGASWITDAKDVKKFEEQYGKLEVGFSSATLDSLNQKRSIPA